MDLVRKYNVAGPRYTSYPTVPYWDDTTFDVESWKESVKVSFRESGINTGISLYIHLPFCESMCTFCGCNKRITKNHKVETPYIESVLKEFDLYLDLMEQKPRIKQIHLGGGTPTFFSSQNLKQLIDGIFKNAYRDDNVEFSFEGHPNNTTYEHLKVLHDLGFSRVCYGVQDYNLKVQKAINRVQPFENVQQATQMARDIGYSSVGHDIIYGLPFQTLEDVISTIEKTIKLKPDRIAFYSYAHVPWIKGNGQRGFKDEDLPHPTIKRAQYETGKLLLTQAGYVEVGMDHYALPDDTLAAAIHNGKLHRNFMGYNSSKTDLMIGLGVSSISDSWSGFAQNHKNIKDYKQAVDLGILPVFRGHILTEEDMIIRRHILKLMCQFSTNWTSSSDYFDEVPDVLIALKELEADGLVILDKNGVIITEKGKPFVRNICLPFDLRLKRKKPDTQLFSMTV